MKSYLPALLLALAAPAFAQQHPFANDALLAPNAPADVPVEVKGTKADAAQQVAAFERHIAPAVKQARATLPQARRRFEQGLPAGQVFFVTIRLTDPDGRFEQVFVRVKRWTGTQVQGELANQLTTVKSFSPDKPLTFPESAVLDWTISRPDGTEEGNYVGKLLDADRQ